MGWWKIKNTETGQIDWENRPTGAGEDDLVNAVDWIVTGKRE